MTDKMRHGKEDRLKSILGERSLGLLMCASPDKLHLAFATDLEDDARSRNISSSQAPSIRAQIDKLLALPCVPNQSSDLDGKGTRLWNLASKLKKENVIARELECLGENPPRLPCKIYTESRAVRVFACSLIDYAQQCAQGSVVSKRFYSSCSTRAEDLHRLKTTSGC